MLDHYVHTAASGAVVLESHRGSITLAEAEPGVVPETVTKREPAATWFATEHGVLLAVIGYAAQAGFDTHAWQLAWTSARLGSPAAKAANAHGPPVQPRQSASTVCLINAEADDLAG